MMSKEIIYFISELIDYAGVAIIAVGAAGGIILYLRDLFQREMRNEEAYQNLRRFLGRSLLLGLEFLVAGDIIKTVVIEPTMDSVLVLAIIVLVRTVLSLSLDVEIDGRWPWDTARLKLEQREAAMATRQARASGPTQVDSTTETE
jgi:uncharacterized membrane protein